LVSIFVFTSQVITLKFTILNEIWYLGPYFIPRVSPH
jgi:hypothetical protein